MAIITGSSELPGMYQNHEFHENNVKNEDLAKMTYSRSDLVGRGPGPDPLTAKRGNLVTCHLP